MITLTHMTNAEIAERAWDIANHRTLASPNPKRKPAETPEFSLGFGNEGLAPRDVGKVYEKPVKK